MIANRIAFTFDFRGPSYTLDTACSSSMFAVDAANKVSLVIKDELNS